MNEHDRLKAVEIDPATFPAPSAEIDHERRVAVFDLVEKNAFRPVGAEGEGPWTLKLALQDGRLAFEVNGTDFSRTHGLSMSPLKSVMRDYAMICDSYYEALRGADPSRIESVDMGRRGLHNEGAEAIKERLAGKAEVDHETARRLFTLVCALFRKG